MHVVAVATLCVARIVHVAYVALRVLRSMRCVRCVESILCLYIVSAFVVQGWWNNIQKSPRTIKLAFLCLQKKKKIWGRVEVRLKPKTNKNQQKPSLPLKALRESSRITTTRLVYIHNLFILPLVVVVL